MHTDQKNDAHRVEQQIRKISFFLIFFEQGYLI